MAATTATCRSRGSQLILVLRVLCVLAVVTCYPCQSSIQHHIDILWNYLRHQVLYQTVYFETWFVVLCYSIIALVPEAMAQVSCFSRYRLERSSAAPRPSIPQLMTEGTLYMLPLAALDTVIVKRFPDVPEDVLKLKRLDWIQRERALPECAPSLGQMVWQVAAALIIYDAMFYIIHYSVHRNAFLYRTIHAPHHDHPAGLHGRVTNRLTVAERLALVLSANLSLRLVCAHPLSRTVFIVVFIGLLVENHAGFDLPWSYDKIIPFGIMGGAARHHAHHVYGARQYQPFFTYIDNYMEQSAQHPSVKENNL
ncbi:cholesterol 25-hydroxylase-like [Branchiostoma lanceolatum]|uniref:cholesterol 25-hydroxylase-like n=1 Tax=Branchiostoma lanceolatum TaxID=7740 RepID=UPI003454DD8C